MNLQKLKEAEAFFLQRYPEGFADPGLVRIRKSHNVDKLSEYARRQLTRMRLTQPAGACDDLLKVVSRSSMVSRFEKPPFRQFIESLDSTDKTRFAAAFEKRLYGRNKRRGFEEICEMLGHYKLAKWSIVSAVPFYFAPRREVFVKPTTAKGIIRYLEVDDLQYRPTPTWEFYTGYRDLIAEVKRHIAGRMTPNNAAVTGFLMMSG